jgi:Fic family protein
MMSVSGLEQARWPNSMIRLLSKIDEYKGKQELYKLQAPEILEALKELAVIQSTESSNRIEGIFASNKRIQALVKDKVTPRDRSEAEIAGYRDVLQLIHSSPQHISIQPSVILQFHRDLMKYATNAGGKWKQVDNEITETLPGGETFVRFKPVPAWRTPDAMQELTDSFSKAMDKGEIHDLSLIAVYILDFLSIHPFADGNGRMARLLTLLLLYRSGYEVGRYISLERIVEETKEQYYDTLYRSSQGWHEGKHDILPWTEYFLTVVLKAYMQFEERTGTIQRSRGWKAEKVRAVVQNMIADFTIADIQERCPGVSRPTIQKVLNQMSQNDEIVCIEYGRHARWKKN